MPALARPGLPGAGYGAPLAPPPGARSPAYKPCRATVELRSVKYCGTSMFTVTVQTG